MNYPFNKKFALSRLVGLSLVTGLLVTSLGGCALLPGSETSAPSTEAPSTDAVELTEPITEAPTTIATEPPTEAPTTEPLENVAIVKEQLNLRINPSTGGRIIAQLDAGEEVVVLRVEPIGVVQWAYVSYVPSPNIMGWIVVDMLDMSDVHLETDSSSTPANPEGTAPQETTPSSGNNTTEIAPGNSKKGVITASQLNIRDAAVTGNQVGSYSYGDRITILEASNGWARTEKGWISLDYVYVDGDVGQNSVYGTVTTVLNVRSGPGTTYDKVKSLNMNDRVQIMEQVTIGGTKWGYTSGGWVSMDYIRVEGSAGNTGGNTTGGMITPGGAGTGTITATTLNVRQGAGTNYPVVGSLNYGDIVSISETTTAEGYTWGHVMNGWVRMDYVRMN